MSSPIRSMFSEVQYELVKIILLNVFLSTVILFLAADLVALMFGMPLWYVIAIAFCYFIVMLVLEIRHISIRRVEETNPELREMLRTAKDNQNQDSLMAHALFYEVIERMKRISSGTFLDFRKLMLKLGSIFVLAIVLVSLAFFNVNIQRFENPLAKPLSQIGAIFGQGTEPEGVETAAGDEIFGDPSMATLGKDQLTATVQPNLDNPDFSKVDPAAPSNDPLADLGGDSGQFNSGDAFTQEGISQKDQERSYNYAKQTQE